MTHENSSDFSNLKYLADKADFDRNLQIDARYRARELVNDTKNNNTINRDEEDEEAGSSITDSQINLPQESIFNNSSLANKNSTPSDCTLLRRITLASGAAPTSDDLINIQRANLAEIRSENSKLVETNNNLILANRNLDNECQLLHYEYECSLDELDELRQTLLQQKKFNKLLRENCAYQRSQIDSMTNQIQFITKQLESRDSLLICHQIIPVDVSDEPIINTKTSNTNLNSKMFSSFMITQETSLQLFKHLNQNPSVSSLDTAVKQLLDLFSKLNQRNEELQSRNDDLERKISFNQTLSFNTMDDVMDGNTKTNSDPEQTRLLKSQIHELKLKLHANQQQVSTYESDVCRLTSQVKRLTSAAEISQKNEEEAKADKRKIQREMRNLENELEDLKMEKKLLQRKLNVASNPSNIN